MSGQDEGIDLRLKEACAEVDAARKMIGERDTRIATLEKDLADERTRTTELQTKAVEMEIDSLIGVKITPAEREEFTELALTNRKMFDRLIAKRAPMTLLQRVVTEDTNNDRDDGPTGNGEELAKKIFEKDLVTR